MRHKLVYKNSASFIYKRIYVSALVVTVKPSARFVRFVLGNVGMAIIFHFTFTETHFQSTSVGCVYICLLGEIFNIHRWCRSACTPAYYTIYTLSHMHTKSFSHSFTHSYTTSACIERSTSALPVSDMHIYVSPHHFYGCHAKPFIPFRSLSLSLAMLKIHTTKATIELKQRMDNNETSIYLHSFTPFDDDVQSCVLQRSFLFSRLSSLFFSLVCNQIIAPNVANEWHWTSTLFTCTHCVNTCV